MSRQPSTLAIDNRLPKPGAYMVQLDGLRAVAALAVIVPHVTPAYGFGLPLGALAVRLFFVLSGFLITGILLRCRDAMEQGTTIWQEARRFYIRRSLRIFPIYYLTLIVCSLVGLPYFASLFGWHALYLTNWYVAFIKHGWIENASHLWSLAVEEQFYLIWPWLIMLTPRRLLLPLAGLAIPLAIGWRLACWKLKLDHLTLDTPLLACIDSLCIGSLLAMCWRMPNDNWRLWLDRLVKWIALPVFILLAIACTMQEYKIRWVYWIMHFRWTFGDVFFALVFVWLIDRAATGRTGLAEAFLSSNVMVYLGRISYGLYLYHNVLSVGVNKGLIQLGTGPNPPDWLILPANVLVTISVASLSWFLIEKPINGLKRHFDY